MMSSFDHARFGPVAADEENPDKNPQSGSGSGKAEGTRKAPVTKKKPK